MSVRASVYQTAKWYYCVALCCILLAACVSSASADPVSWDDIRALKRERKSYTDIVAVIRTRGVAFDVTDLEQRKLRAYGFSRRHIDEIARVAKEGIPAAGGAPPAGAETVNEPAQPAAQLPPAKLKLDPLVEAEHRQMYDQVSRMIEAGEALVQRYPATHVTLIANKKHATRYLPDVVKIEARLRQAFPEPIASGVDRRAANIVLLEDRYHYEKWTRALFKVFKEDGYQFGVNDAAERALSGESFFVRGIYSICLEKMRDEEARRRVAFAAGFQYLEQLARYKAPDGIATGFGNLAETILFAHPSMMLKSGYMDRQLGGTTVVWGALVRQRFAQGKIGSIQNVLAYTTSGMEPTDYAEAWSLTCFLASQPEKFAKLIVALRETEDAWPTISKIYDMDEETMVAKWKQFALKKR